MDLNTLHDSCIKKYTNRWISVGASSLQLSFAPFVCEEFSLLKRLHVSISTHELAMILAENVLTDWKGVKSLNGQDIKYSRDSAFHALTRDLVFLEQVVKLSFSSSTFED